MLRGWGLITDCLLHICQWILVFFKRRCWRTHSALAETTAPLWQSPVWTGLRLQHRQVYLSPWIQDQKQWDLRRWEDTATSQSYIKWFLFQLEIFCCWMNDWLNKWMNGWLKLNLLQRKWKSHNKKERNVWFMVIHSWTYSWGPLREEIRCSHMGYSYWLAARDLLETPG